MPESLGAIAGSRALYGLSGVARLLSGLTLIAAGWLLLRAWTVWGSRATSLAPYVFLLSGLCTVVSGASALLITLHPSLDALAAGPATAETPGLIEAAFHLRWLIGKAGFSAAGVALSAAAWSQWGTLRKTAAASAVLGLGMQFIWWDAATIMHPIVGMLFFIWLLVIGAMLVTGRGDWGFVPATGARRDSP